MSIVVGYADTVEDRNALLFAFLEAKMRGTGVTVVVDGDRSAVDELIMAARADSGADGVAAHIADLVPGRSPVGKLLMGSLSQRVLLDAHCLVVAVEPPVEVAN